MMPQEAREIMKVVMMNGGIVIKLQVGSVRVVLV